MRCERAELAWSERMDGGRSAVALAEALDAHVETCPACAAFADGAQRVRELARITVAEPVPDLVGPIMQRISLEAGRGRARPARWRLRAVDAADIARPETIRTDPARTAPRPAPEPAPGRAPRRRPRRRREAFQLGTALIAGALVGSLVTGTGPGVVTQSGRPVPAAAIPNRVVQAAAAVRTFHATYAVTEWHFRPAVPVRRFTANVWFEAPERFRLDLADHTAYPAKGWAGNDASLVVNGSRWYRSGPGPCPMSAYPSCPDVATQVQRVDHRAPFSAAAAVPTDAVVPVQALADSSALHVLRTGRVLDRPAVEVELPYARARPLFSLLHEAGAWRPFHPRDRVHLWLDRAGWFPLRYVVLPDPSPARARWAARQGLPFEPASSEIFEASATALDLGTPRPGLFAVPRGPSTSEGATSVLLRDLDTHWDLAPVIPERTAGLDLYRVVVAPDPAPQGRLPFTDEAVAGSADAGGAPRGQPPGNSDGPRAGFHALVPPSTHAVISYSRGLTYLNLRERRSTGKEPEAFGVSSTAEEVRLPGGGSALFDAGTGSGGHHLAFHAGRVDVSIESNLAKKDLLEVAGSVAASRREVPRTWVDQRSHGGSTTRVSLDEARSEVPFAIPLPEALPAGYRLTAVERVDVAGVRGVTLYFATETGSTGLRLHLEPASGLPAASSARQYSVRVGGATGRFTPSRNLLEWVADGVYFSLDGAGRGLSSLLSIGASLRSPGGAPAPPADPARDRGDG